MHPTQAKLFPKIRQACQAFEQKFDLIPSDRKKQLQQLSSYISRKIEDKKAVKLIIICTHNSRRSHLGQLWLAVGADYYGLPNIHTYSGGTEATAFNPRAVNALQNIGFDIQSENPESENPNYNIKWQSNMLAYPAFSKKYEDTPNPDTDFAAIMVCTSADEGCPFVQGCDFRIALPFDDPKAYDDTPLESPKYTARAQQIGREMLFVLSQI